MARYGQGSIFKLGMKNKNIIKAVLLVLLLLFSFSVSFAAENYGESSYGSGPYQASECGNAICESDESCGSCSQDCKCNVPSGTSGAGGGANFSKLVPSAAAVSSVIHRWDSIKEGSTISINANTKEISISKLEVTVKNSLSNVEIKIEKLEQSPVKPLQTAYQYLFVDKKNIKDLDIDKVLIKFHVSEKWLKENNIDKNDIVLKVFRYDGWIDLPTRLLAKNKLMDFLSNYVFFEAEDNALSYYAIGIKEIIEEIPKEEIIACVELWECSDWFECIDGKNTRNCNDLNNCGTAINKPLEKVDCLVPEIQDATEIFKYLFLVLIALLVVFYLTEKCYYQKVFK